MLPCMTAILYGVPAKISEKAPSEKKQGTSFNNNILICLIILKIELQLAVVPEPITKLSTGGAMGSILSTEGPTDI